jgi:succinyl-diaminopimelate desuccinylase
MSEDIDVIELARELIRFDTRNPPGGERDCAHYLGKLFEAEGFDVAYYEFDDGRTSLVARTSGAREYAPLCLTGHLDVVPLGAAGWERDPFAGEVEDGLLHGRGSTDMKGGIAAMTVAAIDAARQTGGAVALELVFTASEETGCEGAWHLTGTPGVLTPPGAMVIGEPTSNYPLVGHKGAFWLRALTRGVTAHGSMPETGDNAVYKAARAVTRLEGYRFHDEPHAILGSPSLNVGTIEGGLNMNSVPDRSAIGIDIRTLPRQSHEALLTDLQQVLGEEVELEVLQDVGGIATPADNDWVQEVFAIMAGYLGQPIEERGATYYTDGSVLKPALGDPPTVILGPGDPQLAHTTNEYCRVDQIELIADAYTEIALAWLARVAPDA